jgi:hypothetical protein
MGAIGNWSADTEAAAKAAVALFKETRVTDRDGAIYHLTAQPGPGVVSVFESYDAKTGSAAIVVWAPTDATPKANATTKIVPVGLTGTALYDVTVSTDLSPARTPLALPADTGANLMSGGLALSLSPADGAALVVLTKR